MVKVWRWHSGLAGREQHCEMSLPIGGRASMCAVESYMYESHVLPVIGGFGVTRVVGREAGVWKTDFTCLITDVCLATRPLPGCNYALWSHCTARPTRNT